MNKFKQLLKSTGVWQKNYLILREFKYFPWVVAIAVIASFIDAILSGVVVAAIGVLLNGLTNLDQPPLQTGFDWINRWILNTQGTSAERIYRLVGLTVILIWIQSLAVYCSLYYSKQAAVRLRDRLLLRQFDQLQKFQLSYFNKAKSGNLVNLLTNETTRIQQAFTIFSTFLTKGSTLVVYIAMMVALSWQLFAGALVGFSLLSVGVGLLTRKVRKASLVIPKRNSRLTSIALEFINGIRTVHAHATQPREVVRFREASEQVVQARLRVDRLSTAVQPLSRAMATTMLLVIIALAFTFLVMAGLLAVGSLITFLLALSRTIPLVTQVNGAWANLGAFQGSFLAVADLLQASDKPYFINGSATFSGLKHSIEFVDTSFGYDPKELVLKQINLSIPKGQTTALVGASGAGKTTLADLIPRFYDPVSGKILIDGTDLKAIDIVSLRNYMAIVSQDTYIFNASVRDNVAYGLSAVQESDIEDAIRQANAYEFVSELPNGLDTQLGDRGVRLSGGQRQRLAIARALLRKPEILILDEATSALDSVTERLIQEALTRLSEGRTVISIAHRLSTISQADTIVVLEQGEIVEKGKYKDLLRQKGKLWKYHQIQYELGEVV